MNSSQAAIAIGKILQQLERDMARTVVDISIERNDVTRLYDEERRYAKHIKVTLSELPGGWWGLEEDQ